MGAILSTAPITSSYAGTIKTIHITNPGPAAADMEITFTIPIEGVKSVMKDNPNPSNTFSGVTGTGTTTLGFAGGNLPTGDTDHFNLQSKDNLPKPIKPTAGNLITEVDFSDADGNIITSLKSTGNKEEVQKFKLNVRGFTNEEFFDFSNLNDVTLNISNSDADLNMQYVLSDFSLFKNLPIANFNLTDFMNTNGTIPILGPTTVILNPGDDFTYHLGQVDPSLYELATIGSITTRNLVV